MLFVHKNFIGNQKHFCISEKENFFLNEIPKNSWIFTGNKEEASFENSLDQLFACNNVKDIDLNLPEKYINSFNICCKDNVVPMWEYLLPKEVYSNCLLELQESLLKAFSSSDKDYYQNVFKPSLKVLSGLGNAKIDLVQWAQVKNIANPSIQSLVPNRNGFIKKVKYNRFSTRTGRLRVSDGYPLVLNLPKKNRDIFVSRFPNGKVLQLDFTSLEPRLAVSFSKKNVPIDVYQELSSTVLNGKLNRSETKKAAICHLYGGGINKLSQVLNKQIEVDVLNKIEDYFGSKTILDYLSPQVNKTGNIKNYYGRTINIPEGSPNHIILNSYLQSTAVDVSLLGFLEIVNFIVKNNLNIIPLFLIHDSFVLDCEEQSINYLKDFIKDGIEILKFNFKFPVKIENLN